MSYDVANPWGPTIEGFKGLGQTFDELSKEKRQANLDAMAKEDWLAKKAEREYGLETRAGLASALGPKETTRTLSSAEQMYSPDWDQSMGKPVEKTITEQVPMSDRLKGASEYALKRGDFATLGGLEKYEDITNKVDQRTQKMLTDIVSSVKAMKAARFQPDTIKASLKAQADNLNRLGGKQVFDTSKIDDMDFTESGDVIFSKVPGGGSVASQTDADGKVHLIHIPEPTPKEYKTSSPTVVTGIGDKKSMLAYDFNTAEQKAQYDSNIATGMTVEQAAQAAGGSPRAVVSYQPSSQNNFRMEMPIPVLDTTNGNAVGFATRGQVAADIKSGGNKYLPSTGAATGKAMDKQNLMSDITDASKATRKSLDNLNNDFDSTQRAQFSYILKSRDSKSALSSFLGSSVGQTLKPDQVDYITDIVQLKENAMAMRSVLGAGQGSDEMREAISATIPGAVTADKAYARKQLDKFDQQLGRLNRGVPKVELRTDTMSPVSGNPTPKAGFKIQERTVNGRKEYREVPL